VDARRHSKADESTLSTGYLAFLDPPKDTAAKAITVLRSTVSRSGLTGDNDLITRKVCKESGIQRGKVVRQGQVETIPTRTGRGRGKARTFSPAIARHSSASSGRWQLKGACRWFHGRWHQ